VLLVLYGTVLYCVMLRCVCRDTDVKLVNVADPKLVSTLRGHTASVRGAFFDPKGEFIATSGCDGTMRVWGLDTSKSENKNQHECVHKIPHFLELKNTAVPQQLQLAWSPDGSMLALPGHKSILVVERGSWARMFELGDDNDSTSVHTDLVSVLLFSPCGRYLASAGLDKRLVVWDVKTKQPLNTRLLKSDCVGMDWRGDSKALVIIDGKATIRSAALHGMAWHRIASHRMCSLM
jgi:chromosome transmission fidelity protein 4